MAAKKSKGSGGKKKPAKKAGKKAASKAKPKSKPKTYKHGTIQKYRKEQCRCELCKKANTAYHRKKRRERAEKSKAVTKTGASLSAARRSLRDTQIVQRRIQDWPWDAVAKEAKLSVQATKEAHNRKIAEMRGILQQDPVVILEGLVNGLVASVGDLEQLAVAAADGGQVNSAISAKRAANEAREKLQTLLQDTGNLPRDLGALSVQIEVDVVVKEIVGFVFGFIAQVEQLELPKGARQPVLSAAGQLKANLEQIGAGDQNGGSDGQEAEQHEQVPAPAGG